MWLERVIINNIKLQANMQNILIIIKAVWLKNTLLVYKLKQEEF